MSPRPGPDWLVHAGEVRGHFAEAHVSVWRWLLRGLALAAGALALVVGAALGGGELMEPLLAGVAWVWEAPARRRDFVLTTHQLRVGWARIPRADVREVRLTDDELAIHGRWRSWRFTLHGSHDRSGVRWLADQLRRSREDDAGSVPAELEALRAGAESTPAGAGSETR